MSQPPIRSSIPLIDHHDYHHHHKPPLEQPPPPLISTDATTAATVSASSTSLIREYRKGNWTLHETLVLITAKKLDDERRIKASSTPPDPTTTISKHSSRTAELRWKWVENYCWKHGCLRSQNQCNDKWDNLLRDYKKVRDYESRSETYKDHISYFQMEKHERKQRNLPSNLLSEVCEALNEVVHHRYPQRTAQPSSPAPVINRAPPQPPPPPPPPLPPPAASEEETSDSSETEGSERLTDAAEKKRRKLRNLGSSIVRSASVLAQTLLACEEKKEKRHQDLLQLEERRLQSEETRNEVNRQGIAGVIAAVNNLSGAIQALVSNRHNHDET